MLTQRSARLNPRIHIRLLLPALLLFFLALPAAALEITGLRIDQSPSGEHVSLRLNTRAAVKVFPIETLPPRVAVDLPAAHWKKPGLPAGYYGMVRDLRFGFHDPYTSRLVFDLSSTAAPRNVQMTEARDGYWLEFDLVPRYGRTPHAQPQASEAPPAASAVQLPVIVIDAGHGGQDPGTAGRHGTHEKDVTLRAAFALRDALLATGRYRVTLTRDSDTYLFLRDRVKRARAAHGDLFISLHADSASYSTAHGLSVYTISETASDKESAALATKENKADVIGGMDLSGASEDVAGILIDLAERETRAKSARFADLAVRYLGREVPLLVHTHRFAGFAVLKAPDIPSVLVEMGFLTNPREERLLQSPGYRERIARGLAHAIDAYFGRRRGG